MASAWASVASLFDVVERCAREAGNAIAAIDGIAANGSGLNGDAVLNSELRYAELAENAARIAAALEAYVEEGCEAIATCMPRGNAWYCTYLASAKLGLALAALSTDLRDKGLERRRNAEMVATVQPSMAVVAADLGVEVLATMPCVTFGELWDAGRKLKSEFAVGRSSACADSTLCYCFTGGTTKASRCARVTHRMALHEIARYPYVANLELTDRVLQQHSVYWGASAFGEIDIALAFRCALVFCEVEDSDSVASSIQDHHVTCAGLVPSVLGSLDPVSLPDLHLIFTWGEALSARTAREWARRAKVVDLLISTECWLSLYAVWEASGEQPAFCAVPDVHWCLKPAEGDHGSAAGELLVAGPMVTPGYMAADSNDGTFSEDKDGTRWYCTRDRVERRGRGLVFAGRSDDLIKVGGIWVDTAELQHRLEEQEGVAEAAIAYGRHAFVVLEAPMRPGVVPALRQQLPPDFSLLIVPQLPRHPGTDKVDRAQLLRLIGSGIASQLEPEAQRCLRQLELFRHWYLPAGMLGLSALAWTLLACRPGAAFKGEALTEAVPGALGGTRLRLVSTVGRRFAWELGWRGVWCTYATLVPWHIQWDWHKDFSQWVPFGIWGAVVCVGSVLPGPRFGAALAAPGVCFAAKQGRLLSWLFSWPLVCVFGFPLWVQGSSSWWLQQGVNGSLRWYICTFLSCLQPAATPLVRVSQGLCRRFCTVCPGISARLRRRMPTVCVCTSCQAECAATAGHISQEDELWYCDSCWSFYDKHWQCSRCQAWVVRGQKDAAGAWVCNACSRRLQQQGQQDGQQRALVFSSAAQAAIEAASSGSCPAAPAASAGKCAEWQLIERVTGWTFVSRDASMVGLDSLRVMKVVSSLRRELGCHVSYDRLRRCAKLDDLLLELRRQPGEPPAAAAARAEPPEALQTGEWAIWGMMWTSQCAWCFHWDGPLSKSELREALDHLAERHPSLRAEPRDSFELYAAVQGALTMFELWRNYACPGLHPWLVAAACRAVRRAFRSAWPRAGVRSTAKLPLAVAPHSETAEQAKSAGWIGKFSPPFMAGLATYGRDGNKQGAFVMIRVSHMFSDGYSVVPLVSDLGYLIKRAENPELPLLAPLPSALAVLEQRLLRTIDGDDSMKDTLSPEPLSRTPPRDKIVVFSPVSEMLVSALKRYARDLGVSADILLLTAISVALAYLENTGTVTTKLVVPMRDGSTEGELVGLFADNRVLTVDCGGLSVAGVALQLHHSVRERLWRVPCLSGQDDTPFLNFQWTDLDAHHGLQQVNDLSSWVEQLRSSLAICVEQSSAQAWRLRVSFGRRYKSEDRERFYQGLMVALEAFLTDPLAPAWPPTCA